jgi:hypothetical protein
MSLIVGKGDLPEDITIKKEFYQKVKNNTEFDPVMLTKCYFNKLKFGCTYTPKIEKIIK